ncbi:MAG: light-harvesting antenna LH1, beta subunit [Pseudomonadota bacterium]
MADSPAPDVTNTTGLTDEQCQELHALFTRGTAIWAGVAAVAHLLVWQWKPWFPAGG